jgi:hypothetical protein
MQAAYDGLAAAEAWLREVRAEGDEEAQLDGIAAVVEWHGEIGRIAQQERKR